MENFLKKETIISLITTLIFLIIGAILYVKPISTMAAITYIIEAVLIITGIATIINYIKVDVRYDVFSLGFVQGIVCILVALFLIVNPNLIATILPIVIGIWMIFGSLTRIQIAIKISILGSKTSVWYILFAILMFAIGIICVCNPFATTTIIIKMLGLGIVAYSIIDLIEEICILNFISKLTK